MQNRKLSVILRCTGLALMVMSALAIIPATMEAQATHLMTIGKSCVSPKNRCTTDADCADADLCDGTEQCATEGAAGSNIVDCTITVQNPVTHADDVIIREACDTITGFAGPSTSCDIAVLATDGTGCSAGQNLDGTTITCTLDPGEFVSFRSNFYVIQPADPATLPDQATITYNDTCSGSVSGCSTDVSELQITAATTTVSGCSDGTPVNCPSDGNVCNGPEACSPATGLCVSGPNAADSTACGDTDGNACTTAGCDGAGACDQAHVEVVCTDPVCTACVPATGVCEPLEVLPPECVPSNEICRTPGFWGTHGGTEKDRSTNITLAVLNAYNSVNDPDLSICGRTINNTDAGNVNSALEAICVSVKGDSRRQLARQLTAAALNCIMTRGGDGEESCVSLAGGDVCSGVSVEDWFEACNFACASGDVTIDVDVDENPATPDVEVSCIGAIDCFNNGGVFDPTDGSCDAAIESCHDAELDNGCLDFSPSGPAGSPKECNEARKNEIYVPVPLP